MNTSNGETLPENPALVDLNMDTIVELINRQGVWAIVDQTGGGCATIHAGDHTSTRDGAPIYTAVAGPGTYGWNQRPSMGNTGEFTISTDDQGETKGVDCATVGALTEQAVADLIVAQARLPIGVSLTDADARRTLAMPQSQAAHATKALHDLDQIMSRLNYERMASEQHTQDQVLDLLSHLRQTVGHIKETTKSLTDDAIVGGIERAQWCELIEELTWIGHRFAAKGEQIAAGRDDKAPLSGIFAFTDLTEVPTPLISIELEPDVETQILTAPEAYEDPRSTRGQLIQMRRDADHIQLDLKQRDGGLLTVQVHKTTRARVLTDDDFLLEEITVEQVVKDVVDMMQSAQNIDHRYYELSWVEDQTIQFLTKIGNSDSRFAPTRSFEITIREFTG